MKHYYLWLLSLPLLFVSCTTDRDIADNTIPTNPEAVLVHYWNFNALPSGNLTNVEPDFTLTDGAGLSYEGTGDGYMDAFSPGYTTNARNNDPDGQGIRTRNPSNTRSFIMALPMTGFKEGVVKFATARTGSGATQQNYSYTVDGVNYITEGLTTAVFTTSEDPTNNLVTLDFTAITAVNDNPTFRIKVDFTGDAAAGTSGNNRFDNITLEALPLAPIQTPAPSGLSYTTPNVYAINTAITPLVPTVTGTVNSYTVNPALPEGLVLDGTTGTISGTPTAESPATTYTVTATNAGGSTTTTLSITVSPAPQAVLIHYWNFNALPTGTLTSVPADQTLVTPAAAVITYPGTGAGYMDQVTPGSPINAQNGDAEGLGLRARNPSNTRDLIVKMPTTGYKDVTMAFATEKTGSGATDQNYSYTLDGVTYITTGLATTTFNPQTEPVFTAVTLDFSSISGADNNPNFAVKISFGGTTAAGTSGNNRFDNITLSGTHL